MVSPFSFRWKKVVFLLWVSAFGWVFSDSFLPELEGWRLEEVVGTNRQFTGVAVSADGRLFTNFPRWSEHKGFSVAEFLPAGKTRPYPSLEWNIWTPGTDPQNRFVCVQSVVADTAGFLWVVDAGNPLFEGVVPGAPKLVKVDLKTNEVARVYRFETPIIEPKSYLNDVRVDTETNTAYLTDSGTGALIVLNLEDGKARRLLADHPATKWEETVLYIKRRPWKPNGATPQIHADGLALSPDKKRLYFQALCGRTLYYVSTEALRDPNLTPEALSRTVQNVGRTGAADGMEFDREGNLLLTAIEEGAIHRLTPQGKLECVLKSQLISWPDSFAIGPDGAIYFTTSQIHLGPNPPGGYRVFRLVPPKK